MNLSHVAAAISTSQLIEPFSSDDLALFKQELFKQYNIKNEKDFISKFLLFSTKFVHHDILLKIHDKASKISSESEYGLKKSGDELSSLPSDIIGNIGIFLTKSECILLGYVNRHLYVETQSKSFVTHVNSNSIDQGSMTLDRKVIATLNVSNITGYGYYFPSSITFDLDSLSTMNITSETTERVMKNPMNKYFFDNLFCSVQGLNIKSTHLLRYVPVSLLFNKDIHTRKLKFFGVFFQDDWFSSWVDGFKEFIKNYNDYFRNECDNNVKNIRQIKTLQVSTKSYDGSGFKLNGLFDVLNGTFEEVQLLDCNLENVDCNCLLNKVFHSNLKEFSMQRLTCPSKLVDEIETMIESGTGTRKLGQSQTKKNTIQTKDSNTNEEKQEEKAENTSMSCDIDINCDCRLKKLDIDFMIPNKREYDYDEWYGFGATAEDSRIQDRNLIIIWNLLSFCGIIDHVTNLGIKFYFSDSIKQAFSMLIIDGNNNDNNYNNNSININTQTIIKSGQGWLKMAIDNKKLSSIEVLKIGLIHDSNTSFRSPLAMTSCLFKQVCQSGILKKCSSSLKQITIEWKFEKPAKVLDSMPSLQLYPEQNEASDNNGDEKTTDQIPGTIGDRLDVRLAMKPASPEEIQLHPFAKIIKVNQGSGIQHVSIETDLSLKEVFVAFELAMNCVNMFNWSDKEPDMDGFVFTLVLDMLIK